MEQHPLDPSKPIVDNKNMSTTATWPGTSIPIMPNIESVFPSRLDITPTNHPPLKVKAPFRASEHRPTFSDGIFRVVLVASAEEDAVHVPSLVGMLSKDPVINVQVVATPDSLRFFTQLQVDDAVFAAWNMSSDLTDRWGVRVWTDDDEYAGWKKPGDSILHRELKNWADLVLVAPCSADMLAKVAQGFSDCAALSLLRALPPSTPVILCPAMGGGMFANSFTAKHLATARDDLHHLIVGPRGGRGARNPGGMQDWRDIVLAVQDMAALFQMRQQQRALDPAPDPPTDAEMAEAEKDEAPAGNWDKPHGDRNLGNMHQPIWQHFPGLDRQGTFNGVRGLPSQHRELDWLADHTPRQSADITMKAHPYSSAEHWKALSGGIYWERRWWAQ